MTKTIIGVMGPGHRATPQERQTAYALGQAIAQAGWVVLTGGRPVGVMDAASRGAKAGGGLTICVLPTEQPHTMSTFVDIPIVTGLGQARNVVNVLTSQVVVACGSGPGTTSEIALAIKLAKPIILLETPLLAQQFWQCLAPGSLHIASNVGTAVAQIRNILS
jgi:uncharacterized protein (TIGR00725 family)